MTARWPDKDDTIDTLLNVARSYALDVDARHPEDIAAALTTAIEVAWRTVKQVDA